ncbi:MAG: fluoride efflux transporter CrcB [Alphaproteobacteria bacterium]|nr:fluoride efflux transporter CrcB [Alphaproteobacteria bacterium]
MGGVLRAWVGARVGGARALLLVNASGSFAIGLLAAQTGTGAVLWMFAATGLLGAYTTVSGFALVTLRQWQGGAHLQALGHIIATTGLVIGGVALGLWLGAA